MGIMDFIPQWGGALGGRTQDVSGYPVDDATAQLMLKRRLAQVDALREAKVPQGQMVGGQYVAPSWTQYLGNALSKYRAGQDEQKAMGEYGDYIAGQRKIKQDALAAAINKLKPQAITEEGSYDIQVPNGRTPTPTDNLGGMQPYESGMKNISVPMTTTTGMRNPTYEDALAALGDYATATNQPDLAEKLMMNKATSLMTPDKYSIHNVGDTGYVINERTGKPTGEKLMGTPKREKPQFETFHEGLNKVTYQIMPDGTRVKVATGAAFAPEKPEPDPWHLNTRPTVAPKNAKGWALHTDKNGNMAYVSPDGKSFEEVK